MTKKILYIKNRTSAALEMSYSAAEKITNIVDKIKANNTNKKYGTKDDPVVVNIDSDILSFIITYVNGFNGKKEIPSPEKPIKKVHISVILSKEYSLFENIYRAEDPLGEKLSTLNKYIEAAKYFNLTLLSEKLCAMAASLINNITIEDEC